MKPRPMPLGLILLLSVLFPGLSTTTTFAQCRDRLAPLDPNTSDHFGESVAVSGDYAVVGVPGDDDRGADSGSAYVFWRNNGGTPTDPSDDDWQLGPKLTASNGAAGDAFGASVAISGNVLVVGAPNADPRGDFSGAAYVFERERSGNTWVQRPVLFPTDGAAGDHFGQSVAISGPRIAVGADGKDGARGAAYIYDLVSGVWTQRPRLQASDRLAGDQFGWSVSVSGDLLVSGALSRDERGAGSGAAYVFVQSGGLWVEDVKLLPPLNSADLRYGSSVTVAGLSAGLATVAIGATGDDDRGANAGAIYVVQRSFVNGVRMYGAQTKFTASDGAAGDAFGASVALTQDSPWNRLVVGAPGDDSRGSAYVFQYIAVTDIQWAWVRKFKFSGTTVGAGFGSAVAIRGNLSSGFQIVVGAPRDTFLSLTEAGGAYVLELGDDDNDGVTNACDNCRTIVNTSQENRDSDTLGDACDNCPTVANPANAARFDCNGDGDTTDPGEGVGDQCNSDADPLGDACDNCPAVSNQNQADLDQDGLGDVCDNCFRTPNGPLKGTCLAGLNRGLVCTSQSDCVIGPCEMNQFDSDADQVGNVCDNCPVIANADQQDSDADTRGDLCDNCPGVPNIGQVDSDGDRYGDACDRCPGHDDGVDFDDDDVPDECDNCPDYANRDQADSDRDGIGDACDGDYDVGDELCPPDGTGGFDCDFAGIDVDLTGSQLLPLGEDSSLRPPTAATAAFYYPNVYPLAPEGHRGRIFANETGVVVIQWKNVAGSVGDPVTYFVRDQAAVRIAPYQVVGTKYFRQYPQANVTLNAALFLTIRYNATILDDDPDDPGYVPCVERTGPPGGPYLLRVETQLARCTGQEHEGRVVFQYTSGPPGGTGSWLVGLEVLYITDEGSVGPLSVDVGRRLPVPVDAEGHPLSDGCRAVVVANLPSDNPVAYQRTPDSVDVFPLRPERSLVVPNLIVAWYQSTPAPLDNCWPAQLVWYITDWPSDPQLYIADPDGGAVPEGGKVNLLGAHDEYCGAELKYQEGLTSFTYPFSEVQGNTFTALDEGRSVVLLKEKPNRPNSACGDEMTMEVIASYRNNDPHVFAGEPVWSIGTQIADDAHNSNTPDYPFGFLRRGQPYAPNIYADTGQIIPVNSSDRHESLEIWWFQEGNPLYAPGIFWPYKVMQYNADWPVETSKIVIASRLGAGPYMEEATIYALGAPDDNPSTVPGWNPNDEHASLIPIAGSLRAFAVRDDNPWGVDSGHPYVLVQYPDPIDSRLWRMGVHQVVGEEPPYDFDYSEVPSQADPTQILPVVAGFPIDPLFPVNFGAAACMDHSAPPLPYTFIAPGDTAVWVDRKGGLWAVEETDLSGSPSQATIYLWENWAADGGCQPWRAYGPDGAGSGDTPWPIVYRPTWPEIPPVCMIGGRPNPEPEPPDCRIYVGQRFDQSGQCSVEFLHNGVGAKIIDPTHEVSISPVALPAEVNLANLPPHLVGGEIGGGGEWPDRIRHANGTLAFRGIMSQRDREFLYGLSADATYRDKVDELYSVSRDQLETALEQPDQEFVTVGDAGAKPGWLTLAYGNSTETCIAGDPVGVDVWRVDCPPATGSITIIQPTCPFSEKTVLQFSGDGGGEPENLVFQWQWSPYETGPWFDYNPPNGPDGCSEGARTCYRHGVGLREVVIEGASPFTLADTWWRVRQRGYSGCPSDCALDDGLGWADRLNPGGCTQISDWTSPQLSEGWIKRVVRGLNPFDQRVKDFHVNEVSTYVDMIRQAGMRFESPVAMNCTPANINNLGLIEIYETALRRAREFSIDSGISFDPANLAILLATSKIADLYMLLGNEAFADALDPTIGLFTTQGAPPQTYDPHAVFCFENQLPSLLDEETVLLRGRDEVRLPDRDADGRRIATVYNRLPWNFTSGNGQVAYANNYEVTNVQDARRLYPQGHGDAWGHYLTAITAFYELLRHPVFEWIVSTESVLVGGQPVRVGFQYERKFAQAAAAKARTGAAITSLAFRQRYSADPREQDAYPDDDLARAWGVIDWAQRAGQGAYFDWVTANALLDDVDDDPIHANTVKRIDRTTVSELPEIAAAFAEIQTTLDQADAGLNPLGLATNVVPFGLSPSDIQQGKTHFEQIFERAIAALGNAVTVFNYANDTTQRLRYVRDSANDFADLVEERELDFKARLIEIFGRPYPEDVGPGKSYPSGYDGPDWYHFDYVDPTELVALPDAQSPSRTVTIEKDFIEREIDPQTGAYTENARRVTFHVSTDGLGLVEPAGWTTRPEPGEIQFARGELLQTIGRYQQALEAYGAHLALIESQRDLLVSEDNLEEARLNILREGRETQQELNEFIVIARAAELGLRHFARAADAEARALSEALPQVVGLSNDTTSVSRSVLEIMGLGTAGALSLGADLMNVSELLLQQDKEDVAAQQQITLEEIAAPLATQQRLAALLQLIRGTPSLRLELYMLGEAVNQATGRYYAAVGRGLRLLEQRTAFRQRTADQISQYRYQDMAFRVFRNDALQKYRAQFDMAARYVYLAAKAYDYETSLLGSDSQSGRAFLSNVVKERVLGVLNGDAPMVGNGLAGQLAMMSANWQVIEPQLGFNVPNELTRTFSLRWEQFRIPNSVSFDADWRRLLSGFMVSDLNALQEYNQYCQPLQPSIPNNPAIVIPLSTTVQSGLNLFGLPSTGDATLPSDRFAIKLHSYGVRFSHYPGFPLNQQVNVYLVPVGADIMRTPYCPPPPAAAPIREWHLLDQTLPVPFSISANEFGVSGWMPWDALTGGSPAMMRRRLIPTVAGCETGSCNDISYKLTGRSVWNTRWLLIIPGSELKGSDPADGIRVFINGNNPNDTGVRDIKFVFASYGYSGCAASISTTGSVSGERDEQ